MSTPTLTSAQLGRRLGTGLKMKSRTFSRKRPNIMDLTIENIGFHLSVKRLPILYNFDMLTKEITHNGESFVPLEKLSHESIDYDVNFTLKYKLESNQLWKKKLIPLGVIEKLIEWHFRIDEPEGSFVDVSTLTENPYK